MGKLLTVYEKCDGDLVPTVVELTSCCSHRHTLLLSWHRFSPLSCPIQLCVKHQDDPPLLDFIFINVFFLYSSVCSQHVPTKLYLSLFSNHSVINVSLQHIFVQCMCVVYVCVCRAVCRSQRRVLGVLLYHPPPYCFELGSLTEPGARLAVTKPQWILISTL